MCKTADDIFDGGLSEARGVREFQRSRGYQDPAQTAPPAWAVELAKAAEKAREADRARAYAFRQGINRILAQPVLSSPQGRNPKSQ